MGREFEELMAAYSIERIDGDRPILEIHDDLKSRIERVLPSFSRSPLG